MDKSFDENSIYESAFMLLDNKCNIYDDENALLFDKLTYVIFCTGILPSNKYGLALLNELSKIYLNVKDLDTYWSFTPEFINLINLSFYKLKDIFSLKRGIKIIAKVLREQLVNEPFRNGIEFGILNKLIDLKKTPYFKENLPYDSRIGLGYHAGMVANEEQQLLEDSFFMLISAEKEYEKMFSVALKIKKTNKGNEEKSKEMLNGLNKNICTYCRNGTVNFFAFFEAFLNSIGSNFLYKNEDLLSIEDKFALQGKDRQGNHYLKFEVKIERLQQIIGGKVIYKTNNHQQLKDKSFINIINKFKERRNASVHFSKEKGDILIPPNEWLSDLKDISKYSLDASRKLWKACYMEKDYPSYLRKLGYKTLYDEAKIRMNFSIKE